MNKMMSKSEGSNESDNVKEFEVSKKQKALPFPKGNDHLKL